MRTRPSALATAALLSSTLFASASAHAATSDPAAIVANADVEKVLGGKWTSRSPEPGVLFYEEEGGGYRTVQLYFWPADGKTLVSLKENLLSQGEPVEDVPGIGEAAIYRPQRSEATVEKKNKEGELYWLSIAVQNAADPASARRFAIEIARRGAARF